MVCLGGCGEIINKIAGSVDISESTPSPTLEPTPTSAPTPTPEPTFTPAPTPIDTTTQYSQLLCKYFEEVEKCGNIKSVKAMHKLDEMRKVFFLFDAKIDAYASGEPYLRVENDDGADYYYGKRVVKYGIRRIEFLSDYPEWVQKGVIEDIMDSPCVNTEQAAEIEEYIDVLCWTEFEDGSTSPIEFVLGTVENKIKIVGTHYGMPDRLAFEYYQDTR